MFFHVYPSFALTGCALNFKWLVKPLLFVRAAHKCCIQKMQEERILTEKLGGPAETPHTGHVYPMMGGGGGRMNQRIKHEFKCSLGFLRMKRQQ